MTNDKSPVTGAKRKKRKGPGTEAVIAMVAFLFACLLLIGVRIMIRQELEMNALTPSGSKGNSLSSLLTQWEAQRTEAPTAARTAEPTSDPLSEDLTDSMEMAGAPTQSPLFFEEELSSQPNEPVTLPDVYPKVVEGFLPVCFSRNTDEKVVALTIDDCNQPANLRKIVDLIYKGGGRATIFPIGFNVDAIAGTLQDAVNMGFEIENHTYSHSGLYDVDDETLAYEIWQQNATVSQALGVNYQMHFLRPRGGDNRYDQRTHAYMRQMGYYGIAYWSQVGSDSTAAEIMRKLQPGDIILFHTTNKDLATIRELVPQLLAKGYRMVTLNELYGVAENEQTMLDIAPEPIPLADYERFDQILKKGDYLSDVKKLQVRLSELDYLNVNRFTGYYGNLTQEALAHFQRDNGLDADGICGPESWNALFEGIN